MTRSIYSYRLKIQEHLQKSAEVKRKTVKKSTNSILQAVEKITETFNTGHKVLICGNGGSAADSQHMAAEFVGILNKTFIRPGLPAIALSTNTSVLTAYANDISYNKVFERQVQALGQKGDLLIGISTSGNSLNVIEAIKIARLSKIHTIALIGTNGKLEEMADIVISVPSNNTQYIQETHIAIEHILCELVEEQLFAKKHK